MILISLLGIAFYLDLQIQKTKTPFLKVVFLDVGQGDAIFIEAPNGYQILIDAGKGEQVLKSISKEMKFYDRKIDLLIATHDDADHIGGFLNIFDRYDVKNYADSGSVDENDLIKSLEQKIDSEKLESKIIIKAGQRIILDEKNNIYLDILWPPDGFSDKDRNNASIVAELAYGESEFILTGDAPIFVENFIVKKFPEKIKTDYLKAGHHGSKTSSGELFLSATKPKGVIISAGKDNSYGHPNKEVTDLMQKNSIPYFETSKLGNIKILSDGKKEEILFEVKNGQEKTPTNGQSFSNDSRDLFNYFSFFKSFVDTVLVHSL